MPKLVTVLGTMALALLAGPTFAQQTPPPAATEAAEPDAPVTMETPQAEAPATESSPAAAPATEAPATAAPATDASPTDASPMETPAAETPAAETPAAETPGAEAPASQPAAGPASRPAAGPASQPAAAASQPAGPASQAATSADASDAPADTAAPALVDAGPKPDVLERRLVAYVSTGVAAVALGAGITLGTLALTQYDCLNNVLVCNESAEDPILGDEFLDKKAEVETLSLVADMAYVVAAAATIVAVTGYIRGYFLTEEEPAGEVTP